MPDFDLDAVFAEPPVVSGIYYLRQNGVEEHTMTLGNRLLLTANMVWSVQDPGEIYVLKNRVGSTGVVTAEKLRRLKLDHCD